MADIVEKLQDLQHYSQCRHANIALDGANEIERLRAENERLRAMMRWRPIETAPESTTILFFGGMAASTGQVGRMRRDVERMDGSRWPKWWGGGWSSLVTKDQETWPTHWMPLPKPEADYD